MAQKPVTAIEDSLIVIGGSSGSLDALLNIFEQLDAAFNIPIVIVLHRNSNADNDGLALLLNIKTGLVVKEADEKEVITPGFIYLAPPDYHLLIEQDSSFSLDDSDKVKYSRPSIDVTFQSAASVYKHNLVAILLSGANADGASGMEFIKQNGGKIIVQHPDEALFAYMPLQAIAKTKTENIFFSSEIAQFLNQLSGL